MELKGSGPKGSKDGIAYISYQKRGPLLPKASMSRGHREVPCAGAVYGCAACWLGITSNNSGNGAGNRQALKLTLVVFRPMNALMHDHPPEV